VGTEKARREVRARACRLSDFSGVKLSVATEQRNPYFPFVTQDDYPSADIFRRVADHAGIRVVARPPAYSVSLSARHDLAARLSSKIPKKINCGSLKFLLDSNGSPLTRSRTLLKESS